MTALFDQLFRRRFAKTTHLNVQCNRLAPDRHGIAIAAIVRDEAANITEWLRFHRYAGVEDFFLYDDGCQDDTLARAAEACRGARLTVTPWAQRLSDNVARVSINNQVLAYAHFVANHAGAFRWIAMIDVDEFLVPVEALSLTEALAPLADCPLVALPWVMFGRCGHAVPPAGGVLANYTTRLHPRSAQAVAELYNTKCLIDPAELRVMHVHRPKIAAGLYGWTDEGRRFLFSNQVGPGTLTASRIQLNHYYTRSDAELQAKIAKGSGFISRRARDVERVMRRVRAIEADPAPDGLAPAFIARKDAATGRSFHAELTA